jgi:LmbE family N-acetylglucosaminyl deacetylase
MRRLGVPERNILLNGIAENISDQDAYKCIGKIKDVIADLIAVYNPVRIFTHEFPQAHPDHEVACFATHQAVKESGKNITILEFPLYSILPGQDRANCQLTPGKGDEIIIYNFSDEEFAFRNGMMSAYESQPDIPERYTTRQEQFRVFYKPRDFASDLHEVSGYIKPWIREATPEMVREAFKRFL